MPRSRWIRRADQRRDTVWQQRPERLFLLLRPQRCARTRATSSTPGRSSTRAVTRSPHRSSSIYGATLAAPSVAIDTSSSAASRGFGSASSRPRRRRVPNAAPHRPDSGRSPPRCELFYVRKGTFRLPATRRAASPALPAATRSAAIAAGFHVTCSTAIRQRRGGDRAPQHGGYPQRHTGFGRCSEPITAHPASPCRPDTRSRIRTSSPTREPSREASPRRGGDGDPVWHRWCGRCRRARFSKRA